MQTEPEIVSSLHTGPQNANFAVAPSHPKRIRARQQYFFLYKRLENMHHGKHTFKGQVYKTQSAVDFQSFKASLNQYVCNLL